MLKEILEEEKKADETLTKVAESTVNMEASTSGGGSEENEEETFTHSFAFPCPKLDRKISKRCRKKSSSYSFYICFLEVAERLSS